MTTIVTRAGKGAPLSWVEGDANFNNLNNDKVETADIGVTVQAQNANLQTIATSATAAGLALLDDADAAAQRATLGLSIGSNVQMFSPYLQNIVDEQSTYKNAIINGRMNIDQRYAGTAITVTAGAALAYGLDRWYVYCTGANVTAQRIRVSNIYYHRFYGAVGNTGVGIGQRLESQNSLHMAGKTVTLSIKVSSTSLATLSYGVYYANGLDSFGSLAVPTRTAITTGSWNITGTEATYSATIAMSAGATTGIEVVFSGGALTNGNTLTIRDVQLELGSYVSPIEIVPYDKELIACQRYFETSYPAGNAVGAPTADGYLSVIPNTTSAGAANFSIVLKVSKKSTPTVVAYSYSDGASGFMRDTGGAANRAVTYGSIGTNCINFTNTGVTTANTAHTAHFTATSEL